MVPWEGAGVDGVDGVDGSGSKGDGELDHFCICVTSWGLVRKSLRRKKGRGEVQ